MTPDEFMERAREIETNLKALVSEFEAAMQAPSPSQAEQLAHAGRLLESRHRNMGKLSRDLSVKDKALARVVAAIDEARLSLSEGKELSGDDVVWMMEQAVYGRAKR